MATRQPVASDSFDRADNSSLGADWGNTTTGGGWGAPGIASNACSGGNPTGNGREAGARWVGAGSFTDDHYASAIVAHPAQQDNNYRCGCQTRASADQDTARDSYQFLYHRTGAPGASCTITINKIVNGTFTQLWSGSSVINNGSELVLESVGSEHSAYV